MISEKKQFRRWEERGEGALEKEVASLGKESRGTGVGKEAVPSSLIGEERNAMSEQKEENRGRTWQKTMPISRNDASEGGGAGFFLPSRRRKALAMFSLRNRRCREKRGVYLLVAGEGGVRRRACLKRNYPPQKGRDSESTTLSKALGKKTFRGKACPEKPALGGVIRKRTADTPPCLIRSKGDAS